MNGKRAFRLTTAIFLLLLCSTAFGQLISVVIQPKIRAGALRLYPYEVAAYEIFVINNGQRAVENINLVVRVDEGLVIVFDMSEITEKRFIINRLLPAEQEVKGIMIKALQPAAKKDLKIFIEYGIGEDLTHAHSTSLVVVDNPIMINARLSKTAITPGEEGSVLLDMTNSNPFVLYDINVALYASDGLEVISEPYYVESLDPNQSFHNKEFKFVALKGAKGGKNVVLKLGYADKEGQHTIEKNFAVDVQNRVGYIFVLVVGIIVLVVVSYLLRQKNGKQTVDTGIKFNEVPPPPPAENNPE